MTYNILSHVRSLEELHVIIEKNPVFGALEAEKRGEEAERMYQRFRQDPNGARILAERRWLRTVLLDQERLRRLAPGSLGRAYVDYLDEENLNFEWLVRTSASAADEILGELDEERRLVIESVTDQHDLWHVLTGYGTDELGELAVTAFIYEQVR